MASFMQFLDMRMMPSSTKQPFMFWRTQTVRLQFYGSLSCLGDLSLLRLMRMHLALMILVLFHFSVLSLTMEAASLPSSSISSRFQTWASMRWMQSDISAHSGLPSHPVPWRAVWMLMRNCCSNLWLLKRGSLRRLMSFTETWKVWSTTSFSILISSSLLVVVLIFFASEDFLSAQEMERKSASLMVSARLDSLRSKRAFFSLKSMAGICSVLLGSINNIRTYLQINDLTTLLIMVVLPLNLGLILNLLFRIENQGMNQLWQQGPSMEAIPEETERLTTENHIREENEDSQSFELLIKAYDRIRALETENEELQQKMFEYAELQATNNQLFAEAERLRGVLREREIKINNLEKMNQKAILDYVKIQRELAVERNEGRLKRNLTVLPNELSSPLHPSIRNEQQPRLSRDSVLRKKHTDSQNIFKKQERLKLVSDQNKPQCSGQEFTFDGGLKKLSQSEKQRVLKNCVSMAEMSKLVSKVHSRHDSQLNGQKAKLREYQHFCSSMEKKYSPSTSLKKESGQAKKYPLMIRQCASPKTFQFRGSTPQLGAKGELGSTSSSNAGGTFNIWLSEKYNFNC